MPLGILRETFLKSLSVFRTEIANLITRQSVISNIPEDQWSKNRRIKSGKLILAQRA